ncbi:MAG: hypothetical protein IJF74_00130 [Clostridia bacterium]|nr:hypothetical protein [Clostridia bacterium]
MKNKCSTLTILLIAMLVSIFVSCIEKPSSNAVLELVFGKDNQPEKIFVSDDGKTISAYNVNAGISDFYLVDGEVHIVSGITVKNNSDSICQFRIAGKSEEDFESGLLSSPHLIAVNYDTQSDVFQIEAFSQKTFRIVYIGKQGDFGKKYDRLVPNEISIIIIDSAEQTFENAN